MVAAATMADTQQSDQAEDSLEDSDEDTGVVIGMLSTNAFKCALQKASVHTAFCL